MLSCGWIFGSLQGAVLMAWNLQLQVFALLRVVLSPFGGKVLLLFARFAPSGGW